MMERTNGRTGNGRIDLRIKGFGEFRKSAGTTKPAVFRRRVALVRLLGNELGEHDLLRALLNDEISWGEIERAQRQQRLRDPHLLASVRLDRPLEDALQQVLGWLLARRKPRTTIDWYRTNFGYLVAPLGVLHKRATVRDLSQVDWPLVLAQWEASPATKNGLRRAISRALTILLEDKFHPFRRALMNPDKWPIQEVPKRSRAMNVELFWQLIDRVPERLRDCYLLLAVTGMRVGEYLNDAHLTVDRMGGALLVKGKTDYKRYAIAPNARYLLASAVPCRAAPVSRTPSRIQNDPRYRALLRAWQAAGAAIGYPHVGLHDLRRLYVRAGVRQVGETATQHAVGHETAEVTREYAREDRADEVAVAVADYLGIRENGSSPTQGVA